MNIAFTFPGEPIPASRARVTSNGTFTPARYREYKQSLVRAIKAQFGELMISEPLQMTACFFRKTKRRVDIDNLFKSLADAMTQARLITDDSLIMACGLAKAVDKENPRVEFTLQHFS